MSVITVVRKYIIKDLTGVISSYYTQNTNYFGSYGYWKSGTILVELLKICDACTYGYRDIVKRVLTRAGGCKNLDWCLYRAIIAKRFGIAKMLMKNGVSRYDPGLWGACLIGDLKWVKRMIKKGADDWRGAFKMACEGGNIQVLRYIVKGKENWEKLWITGLYDACKGGNREVIELVIEKGGKNWTDGLFGACEKGHFEIVKLMIDKGAVIRENIDRWPYTCHPQIHEFLGIVSKNKLSK